MTVTGTFTPATGALVVFIDSTIITTDTTGQQESLGAASDALGNRVRLLSRQDASLAVFGTDPLPVVSFDVTMIETNPVTPSLGGYLNLDPTNPGPDASPGNPYGPLSEPITVTGSATDDTLIARPRNSLTANLGNGDDSVTIRAGSAATVSLDGGSQTVDDELIFESASAVSISPGQLSSGGTIVNHSNFETINIVSVGGITVDGTAASDTIEIVATGANSGTMVINGGAPIAFSNLTSLTVNGNGGNDILRINNPVGGLFAPTGGIDYNGGGQSADALEVLGGGSAGLNETYFVGTTSPPIGSGPGDNGSGLLRFTGSSALDLRFTGLAPIVDTVAAASLTINATDAANNISVTDGVAPRLVVAVDAFEPIEFNNKSALIINAGDGVAGGDLGDTINVNFANVPAGLGSMTINADEGDDVINLQAKAGGFGVTTNGLDGADTINAGFAGSMDLITGAGGAVFNGGNQVDTVNFNDNADASNNIYTLTNNTLTRAGSSGVSFVNTENVALNAGTGTNTINVTSSFASVATTVNAGTGNSTINVSNAGTLDSLLGVVTVDGQGGVDNATLDDSTDATSNTYDIFNNLVTRVGSGNINYSGLEDLTLLGGTSDDRVNVRSTLAGTTYNILTANGSDAVVITNFAFLDDIDGQVNISTGSGNDSLTLSDGNDADADTYALTLVAGVTELTFNDGAAAVDVRYDVVGGPGQLENFTLATGTGDDVVLVNNTTATSSTTIAAGQGSDQMTIAGDNLTGDNKFSGDDNIDDFVLNIAGALAGTSATIEGNNTSLNSASRDQLRINDAVAGRSVTYDKGNAATELNVNGLGTALQTNTLESLIYAGINATASVRGSSGTDDITVAGRVGSAQVFFGGNPWDGPAEGAYASSLPGVAGPVGTVQSPDLLLLGMQLFSTIAIDGDGGVDDQVYFYGANEADLLDPANAAQPVFRGVGFANGVLIPGLGVGAASETMGVSGAGVFLGAATGVFLPNSSQFAQSNPNNPGLVVNGGDESGLVGDRFIASSSGDFKIQINGGDPPTANAPNGDSLLFTSFGTLQVYSDKVGNVSVASSGGFPVTHSSIERVDLSPGNGFVQLIGDNNDPAVEQTDHFVVVGQDVGGDGGDPDGANEFTLRINGDTVAPNAPAIYVNNVTNLDVFGADLTGADTGQVDTLDITPWADNTPRGWGIATTFDEDEPAGADGAAVDLLVVHTALFGGPISEDIVVRPSGMDNGEVIVRNGSFDTPIANIAYVANTDIIVTDDDGFLSDTDTLTLLGTNIDPVNGLNGNNTFTADFTANGDAANPILTVTDNGNLLYRLRTNPGVGAAPFTFNTVNILGLGGNDTIGIVNRADGSLRVNADGGLGSDTVSVRNSTAGNTTYTPGSTNDAASIVTPNGTVQVLGSEFIGLTGAAATDGLTTNGTHDNDTIALQNLGGSNRVWINAQSVISFASFGTVNLAGRFGDDKFNVLPVGLAGVTTINVNGGDSTNADSVVISSGALAESVTISPSGVDSATVTGLGATINVITTESLFYNGMGGGDLVTINGTALDDTTTVSPSGIGTGSFRSGASPLVNLQAFSHLTLNPGVAGGYDSVEINGTIGPDIVTSNADTVTLGGAVTLSAGIDQLDINSLDGNDNVDLDLQLAGLKKVIRLGEGNDISNLSGVIADGADPIIYGSDGDDIIVGSPNVDYIYGGSGTDVIQGLANVDYIEGGDGNDTITGGTGNDVLHGGDGSDVIIWNNGDNTDVVEGGTGDDRAVVNGAGAGDTFTIFADATNPSRVAFNRTNLVPFALDIADVEEFDVNSGTGTDNISVGDLTTTALRALDLDLGVEAGVADTVTVNGRTIADKVQMTGAGTTMTMGGLRYDVRVINALAGDNDDFTFNAQSGDDEVVAADSVAPFFAGSDVLANNHFSILGGDGNDSLSGYGLLNGQAGDDTLVGSATIAPASGNQILLGGDGDDTMIGGAGNDSFDGGLGVDTILVLGTPGNDVIDINQTADITLVERVNSLVETDTLALLAGVPTVERVNVQAGDGSDTIRVQWADGLGTDAIENSLLVNVDGGLGATGDRLGVIDDGIGDLILLEQGNTSDSGAMAIGPRNAEPLVVNFTNVETAQPIPAADGDVVVFKHDPFEFNNIRTSATYLGANSSINVDPTINPGLDTEFNFPADEDWYRVVAEQTGVLDFQVYFRQISTVASGRPGLPGNGNLDISVTDATGNVVAGFGTNDSNNDERVRIPAVQGQTYYLRVFANAAALNVYNITVMNYAPPVPHDLELLDSPVGDGLNSDTGRSQLDNVTRDNTPTVIFRLDDAVLLNDIQGNNTGNNPPDENIPIPFRPAAGPSGYRVAIFDEGSSGSQTGTAPQIPLGFASLVGDTNNNGVQDPGETVQFGVYQFTTPALADGSHFLTARTQMVDPSAPQQTGFGERSVALEVVVDTAPPPGFFGQINLADTTQGLAAESDSGVGGVPATFVDRVTNDTTPSVYGRAEADAIIRVYTETNGVAGLQSSGAGADLFLGLTTATPLDGTNQFPGGQWSFTTPLDLNNPNLGFSKDGLRSLYVTSEDLAGNVTTDGAADRLNIFLDTAGPQVTDVEVTGSPAYNLFGLKDDNTTERPTPRVDSLTIRVQDLPRRSDVDPNFLYAALQQAVATTPGNIVLRGDHSGIIAIRAISFTGVAPANDTIATGSIVLDFFAPLPDDRYTLTIKENVVDPVGNKLDGESNASQPTGNPNFASGDGQPGGDFVARFTVDSRPEIGTVSQGLVYVDINGNFEWDPTGSDNDATNRDFVMQIGTVSDAHFAGNFSRAGAAAASGFDKLGVYGIFEGTYSFLIDTDDDGVGDVASAMPPAYQVNGIPVAGNFSAAHPGDEIGLFDGSYWYLDTNGNNQIDLGERIASNFNGIPVVGSFNAGGTDDLATYDNSTNTFHFDLNRDGTSDATWEVRDTLERFGGLSGFTDRPVAGDLNLDGIDDIGLWVKGRTGQLPEKAGEYFFWVSDTLGASPAAVFNAFSPAPLGNDLFAQFGDENALPVFGNFDPPVQINDLPTIAQNYLHNFSRPLDVNRDNRISPSDALSIINALNSKESVTYENTIRSIARFDYRKIDTNNSGTISPTDALIVINYLNSHSGNAEGEDSVDEVQPNLEFAAQVDAYFGQLDIEEVQFAKRRLRR